MYILLAILALSFLIFIHELGHYWMARRVGMRVETFAIGFGRPIFSWIRKGVRWQIGWLPFGGYVKIAGQDLDKDGDPYKVPDGFFGKSPWDRIKVAFMGPLVNILFAFLVFVVIWMTGGREKTFAEFTHVIGWVDQQSELYKNGIRPGDEIIQYNDNLYTNASDNVYAPTISGDEVEVRGFKINYESGEKIPFIYKVNTYPHPNSNLKRRGIKTAGILNPANYFIYHAPDNGWLDTSSSTASGIQNNDRIMWVDGEMLFSMEQLSRILNDHRALLTILHNDKIELRRVPRVELQELKLDPEYKEEFIDWQHEAQLNAIKTAKLLAIPYNLNNECVVENALKFIDSEKQDEVFSTHPYSKLEMPLEPGDKIIAVDGDPVVHSYQLLAKLQEHHVNVIVQRIPADLGTVNWKDADAEFRHQVDGKDVLQIAQSIGTGNPIKHSGSLYLLNPIQPKTRLESLASPEKRAILAAEMAEQRKEIDAIKDPEKRAQTLQLFDAAEKKLLLGLPFQDRKVIYNPLPTVMFEDVINQIGQTLRSLVSGMLNIKALSGPVGIVKEVYTVSQVSLKESLYFLGFMSLNLGIFNLLPIPILDGGTIMITLLEIVTRRRISPKTLERIMIPFALLLVGFFIYVTFNDLSQWLTQFQDWFNFWK